MRLVDADKLTESLHPETSVWVGMVLVELLANTPTVEAIPIEIIRKRIEGYRNSVINISDIEVKNSTKHVRMNLKVL